MSKVTEYAAATSRLESEIALLVERSTEDILEYLALVTGGFNLFPIKSEDGERPEFAISFRAVNPQLNVEFNMHSAGVATTIRDAAIFAAKGALAWYKPWEGQGDE